MSVENQARPRVGIPWRTSQDESKASRKELEDYFRAVEKAGAEAVVLSLTHPEELQVLLPTLDAFVLPGSGADIEPAKYGAPDKGVSNPPDALRERTDRAILDHAIGEKKPVLAICFGCQLLNVHLGGTLVQDVRRETATQIAHHKRDIQASAGNPAGAQSKKKEDPRHGIGIAPGSRLAALAGGPDVVVNSSHHQAIDKSGRNLRVTAHATDGVAEAVEWTSDANWIVGVQWHPERMIGDRFSEELFADFVAAARTAVTSKA